MLIQLLYVAGTLAVTTYMSTCLYGSGNVFGAKNGTLDSTPEALRNRDEDEKYVFPLLRNPIVQSLPTKQVSHPFIYTTDVSSRDEIITLNNGLNWKQALFGKNATGYFLSRFPVDPHRSE